MQSSVSASEPRVLQDGVQCGAGQIESREILMPESKLCDDAERLGITFKPIGVAGLSDQFVQPPLGDVSERRMTQVMGQCRRLNNVWINPT